MQIIFNGGIGMDKELLLENIEMEAYSHGKATLVAGMCKKLGVINIFDQYLTKQNGRKPDIAYGIMAQMMLANLCHSRRPLYLMDEYFEHIDIEGTFNSDAKPHNLTDDRFGCFLDNFHEAGPRKIFSEISMTAFATYGLSIKNINYDTTSKVMWGQYETEEGKIDEISIDYGYSKDKRNDKKQIKIGIGTANGIVVDAKVLSGNTDDKTYNNDAIDDVDEILKKSKTSKDSFYYVADSAFFTEENINKANGRDIKFITRAPETTNMSKIYIGKFFSERQLTKDVIFENAQGKKVKYQVLDYKSEYKGIPVKLAVCYSFTLEETKRKTISRHAEKEYAELEKKIKVFSKRSFACEADSQKEIEEFLKTKGKKLKYHSVNLNIEMNEKRKRKKADNKDSQKEYEYTINLEINREDSKIEAAIERECTFILASNDSDISCEEMLKEYKTQSSVEKKFQQLKAPEFIDDLFVKTPKRVEALTYMILIGLMILSVMEHVVRREMKKDNTIILGPGKIKMSKPSLKAIMGIFEYVPIQVIKVNNNCIRKFQKPLKDNQRQILNYLGLDESIFVGHAL